MSKVIVNELVLTELARACFNTETLPALVYRCLSSKNYPKPVYQAYQAIYNKCIDQTKEFSDAEFKAIITGLPLVYEKYFLGIKTFPEPLGKEMILHCYIFWKLTESSVFREIQNMEGRKETSVVLRKFPELKDQFDDDDLLKINQEFSIENNGVKYKGYHLYIHPLFPSSDLLNKLGRVNT